MCTSVVRERTQGETALRQRIKAKTLLSVTIYSTVHSVVEVCYSVDHEQLSQNNFFTRNKTRIKKESDEEQHNGKEERLIPTKLLQKTVVTYAEVGNEYVDK